MRAWLQNTPTGRLLSNGLIWNLLYRYTTDLGTARERPDAEVLARHPHIPGFEALFAVLKHRCRLMIPCGKAAAPATRLAHDALAPLLQARRAASDAPGPRALRIVEIKERELRASEMNYDYQHPYNDEDYIEAPDQKGQGQTSPVYRYAPNALGLYDMSGNVYDWCWDRWSEGATDPRGAETSEARRVVRGGSWGGTAIVCRSSFRYYNHPVSQGYNVGFRVFRRSS
ncbi:MAG: hypothetical protein OHK0039_49290 [Bacteroidia bacterium]